MLQSLITAPIQALPKYMCTLQDVICLVNPSTKQYAQLQVALGLVRDAHSKCEDIGSVKEEGQEMLKIQEYLGIQIIEPHRKLIRKSGLLCLKTNKWEEVGTYLFTDIICYGFGKLDTKYKIGTSTKIRLAGVEVDDVVADDAEEGDILSGFVFKLTFTQGCLHFKASSATLKRAWMADIINCITAVKQSLTYLHEKEAASIGVASFPIERFSPSSMRLSQRDIPKVSRKSSAGVVVIPSIISEEPFTSETKKSPKPANKKVPPPLPIAAKRDNDVENANHNSVRKRGVTTTCISKIFIFFSSS
jgi:hypothetical protein